MWEWRDIFLGIGGYGQDTRTGLELARKSSLPEAQWLCKLFPEDGMTLDDIMIALAFDDSAAGNYYLFWLSDSVESLIRSRNLEYPLAQDIVNLSVACEQYGNADYYYAYAMSFNEHDVRRYLWLCKCRNFTACTKLLHVLHDNTMPSQVMYTIGRIISTEGLHTQLTPLFIEHAARNAIKLVKDTDSLARQSLIVWILWAKLHSHLINADIRKLIVRQVWKDRIEWSPKIQ